jgi:hypothetical protein
MARWEDCGKIAVYVRPAASLPDDDPGLRLAGGWQRSSGQRCRGQRDRHAVRDNLDEVAACGRAELGIELRSSRDDPEITHVGAGHGIGRSGPQA